MVSNVDSQIQSINQRHDFRRPEKSCSAVGLAGAFSCPASYFEWLDRNLRDEGTVQLHDRVNHREGVSGVKVGSLRSL